MSSCEYIIFKVVEMHLLKILGFCVNLDQYVDTFSWMKYGYKDIEENILVAPILLFFMLIIM